MIVGARRGAASRAGEGGGALGSSKELRAADRRDQGIAGGRRRGLGPGIAIAGTLRGTLVARRGQQVNLLFSRLFEDLMLLLEQDRIDAAFVFAKALGDDVAQVVIHGVFGGAQDIDVLVAFGQNKG